MFLCYLKEREGRERETDGKRDIMRLGTKVKYVLWYYEFPPDWQYGLHMVQNDLPM